MGSIFSGGGSGGGGGGQTVQYAQPPAPGTLRQTIISGNPNPSPAATIAGETEEQRRQRLASLQDGNILGGGNDGGAGGASGPGDSGPGGGPGGGGDE